MSRLHGNASAKSTWFSRRTLLRSATGNARISTRVASLVDTNILVYRFDARDAVKQHRAREVLRDGLLDDNVVLAHQCIVEFVAAVSLPRPELAGAPLLPPSEATLEAETLLTQYPVLY